MSLVPTEAGIQARNQSLLAAQWAVVVSGNWAHSGLDTTSLCWRRRRKGVLRQLHAENRPQIRAASELFAGPENAKFDGFNVVSRGN
jgi:hypothetical protein